MSNHFSCHLRIQNLDKKKPHSFVKKNLAKICAVFFERKLYNIFLHKLNSSLGLHSAINKRKRGRNCITKQGDLIVNDRRKCANLISKEKISPIFR